MIGLKYRTKITKNKNTKIYTFDGRGGGGGGGGEYKLCCNVVNVNKSHDIIAVSLCGVRVHVNNFSKSIRPRDTLFLLKDSLSIKDEKC